MRFILTGLFTMVIATSIALPERPENHGNSRSGDAPAPWDCGITDWRWAETHHFFLNRLAAQRHACGKGQNFRVSSETMT